MCEKIVKFNGYCGDLQCKDCPLSDYYCPCGLNSETAKEAAKQWLKDHKEEWEEYYFLANAIFTKECYGDARRISLSAPNGVVVRDSYDYKIEIIDGVVYGYRKPKSNAKKKVTLELTEEQLEKIKEIIE